MSLIITVETNAPTPFLILFQTYKMQKTVLVALLVAVILVVGVTSQDSMLAPPDRPTEFRSPDELRRYLKALNEYYAIVGRPR